ncbi:MAG: hypothetical protein M1826_003019 [Phylliscum demangeonii]|nr:MAG: hypothetical protein M1826_003019 [Phylliscum demangeonii]
MAGPAKSTGVDNSAQLTAQQAHGGVSGPTPAEEQHQQEQLRQSEEKAAQDKEKGKTRDQSEIDREYEERMEDEYAKREGGA